MRLLYDLVVIAFNVMSVAILARVIATWLNVNPFHPAMVILREITEPVLGPLRRLIPTVSMIDISPIVALVLLQVVERILLSLIVAVF
jgi:YggT family protein